MIKFKTDVELSEFPKKIGYRHQFLMIGSCFAENLGIFLQERALPIQINPFGVLYNPQSIANCLELILTRKIFTDQDLFYFNGLYHSFSHHSRYSGSDKPLLLKRINAEAAEAYQNLKGGSHLFITFGTSWVFQHKERGTVVSNCHKLPAATFNHNRLSVDQIIKIWIPVIEQLKLINPKLHLVFTVSPIRHLKDGAHGNQLSKSILLLAIDEIISIYGNELITYFPSYEIILDELRDYRFYARDMTHLSELAIDYIREKFLAALMEPEAIPISDEAGKLLQSIKHKPFNSKEEHYITFLNTQFKKMEELQKKYSFVNFQNLRGKFDEKIIN